MRTQLQRTSCVVDEIGQCETMQEVIATTTFAAEARGRPDARCRRALQAERRVVIVIAGLFFMDAAEPSEAAEGMVRNNFVLMYMRAPFQAGLVLGS